MTEQEKQAWLEKFRETWMNPAKGYVPLTLEQRRDAHQYSLLQGWTTETDFDKWNVFGEKP